MTSAITGNAFAAVIRRASADLGAALPAAFETALDQAKALRETTAQIEGSAAAVNQRIINCLKAGKDWRVDKELQALALERVAAANGIRQAGTDAAEELIKNAVVEYADAIITTWSEALKPDVAALAVAAERLDMAELSAGDVVGLTRRGLTEIWGKAQVAEQRIAIAVEGWKMIAAASGLHRSRDYEPLIITEDLPDSAGQPVSAWTVARSGKPLSLATPAEYRARVQRHEAALQEQRRAHEAQQERDRKRASV